MGVALYIMMHDNRIPTFLRGLSTPEAVLDKLRSLPMTGVLHQGNSLIDILIKGLLTVDVRNRFDSGGAMLAARLWAASEGVSREVISDIIGQQLDGKREQLSRAWEQCLPKNCHTQSLRNGCAEIASPSSRSGPSASFSVACVYPCRVSTSGFGASCKTCQGPPLRETVDHCSSCNPGYEVRERRCRPTR